jgi:hypothetical protein
MKISVKRKIAEAIKHRFITNIDVDPDSLDNVIVDVLAPTYLADWNRLNNYQSMTISPTLSKWIGTDTIPFNKLISISGIDMSRLKINMRKLKSKELDFASIGYGGLSINVLHFMSLLAYRVGVDEPFNTLHVFEDDLVSYSNMLRFYKDMFKYPVEFSQRVFKLELFDEENLARNINLHKYRLDEQSLNALGDSVVLFGAPDFETRKMLEGRNFMFAGHQGDNVIIVKSPVVDDVITRETYGTINLSSFFINMLVVTDAVVDLLANGFFEADDDSILFEHNAKMSIINRYPRVRSLDYDKGISVYSISDKLSIAI